MASAEAPLDMNAPPMNMSTGLGTSSILNGFTADGRPIQVRPCKYYPNCAKMDDPEHNAMYSHLSEVKRVPKEKRDPSKGPTAQGTQLCGFGDQCKRCGDEDHLDKFIHSCKFGDKCKKMDDPIHLKHFIHVPGLPTGPTIPTGRGARGGAFPAFPPYGMPAYPPYGAYYGAMANPYNAAPAYPAGPGAGAGFSPSHTHHARSSAGYHPYGRPGGAGAGARSLYGAADPLAAASGYGADRSAAGASAYSNYYNEAANLMQNVPNMSQYGM